MTPEPRYVTANDIQLAVYAAGEPSARPPVILCHGFPELAYSWRHQIKALAEAGYHVLAPDQRGYGKSDKPGAVADYAIEQLCLDLVGLLDAEGIERAVFAGHDWGGLVVWEMARRHSARVAGVIGLNTPYLPRSPIDPVEALRMRFGPDHYIVFFQTPEAPEQALEADLTRTFRFFIRKMGMNQADFAKLPAERRNFALIEALKAYNPEGDPLQFLSAEEIAVYVDAYKAGGFFGPVSWYRNFSGNWARSADLPERIDQPCLMIMAENDLVLPPSLADGMETRIPRLEKALIPECGHWTQQEKPEETSRLMVDWLRRTFG